VNWTDYWNTDTTIYANARHKRVHFQSLAADLIALVPSPIARVLDFGCGEALSASDLANACGSLILSDSAPNVRARLAERHASQPKITVASTADLEFLPDGAFDLIIANSVVQYLSMADLAALLPLWHRLLAPGGHLILGDIIPPSIGPISDAAALLKFGAANGFAIAAGTGLVKTFFSDYRKIRAELGLLRFEEAEILTLMRAHNFRAQRRSTNIGHNQNRMTIDAIALH
jgi:ubiquinone/menaquinone biosynthesis C-methylase UbiE